jgi:Mrp family chromosome partitioning ATPase
MSRATMMSPSHANHLLLLPTESWLRRRLAALKHHGGIVLLMPAVSVAATLVVLEGGTPVVVAGFAGLLLGVVLAVVGEALESRIRDRREAEDAFGAPVLGAFPKKLNRPRAPGVAVGANADDRAAALALLDVRVEADPRNRARTGSAVLVTSPGPRTGKAAVAGNLAAALAHSGARVVCVDADVLRPALHAYLGTPSDLPGLVDVLESSVELEEALIGVEFAPASTNGATAQPRGRLEVLQAGRPPSRPDLLTLETVDRLLTLLRERAEYVVLDAPTLLVSDVFPLAVNSDKVLIVARRGRTTKSQADSARRTLDGLGVEDVGVVLTDVRPRDGSE